MLTQMLAPVMAPIAMMFILLNIFQLHVILRKYRAARERDEPASLAQWEFTRTEMLPALSSVAADNNTGGAHSGSESFRVRVVSSVTKSLKQIPVVMMQRSWLDRLYWPGLLVASFLLFSTIFIADATRQSDFVDIELTWPNAVFAFLAVHDIFVHASFVVHLWLASLLFVVQAAMKLCFDRMDEPGRVCFRKNEQPCNITESVTLLFGVLSVVISLSATTVSG
jgi:hypothetical protein